MLIVEIDNVAPLKGKVAVLNITHIFRSIKPTHWIKKRVTPKEITLSFVINGDIKLYADKIIINNGTIIEHVDIV